MAKKMIGFSRREDLVLASDLICQALAVTEGMESVLNASEADRLVEDADAFCVTEKGMNVLLAVPTVLRLFLYPPPDAGRRFAASGRVEERTANRVGF